MKKYIGYVTLLIIKLKYGGKKMEEEKQLNEKERLLKILESLEGITYKEWKTLKNVIDNRYVEIKNRSIFTISENTLKNLSTLID